LGNPKSASELSFKCRCAETSARQRQARELIVIVRFLWFFFVERGRFGVNSSLALEALSLCFALVSFKPHCHSHPHPSLSFELGQSPVAHKLPTVDNRSPLPTTRSTPVRRSLQESAMGEDQKAGKRAIAVGDDPVVLQETQAKHATPPAPTQTKWNTDKLGLRMGSDALAAGAAGALVAPIITIIDKGIMENASGRHPLGESLKKSARELLLKPHHFLTSKPFALIFVRSLPVLPRKASASKHKLIRDPRLSTSAPTSPPTQSTPSPPRAHKPPSPQPPPAPRSSPLPQPPTWPCASTKTTNSPSSSAHPGPNGPSRSPHSPSSPCATASPSSPRSTCRPCSRPSWRRRWARR
jgi:hypothetical protein